jgi:tetratricopeptide (TPR) repeat protein
MTLGAMLVLAIAGGSPALAKKVTPAGPPVEMSDAFRADLAAARAALQAGDVSTAAGRVSALTPTTDFEVYAAAAMRFELATRRRDVQAQRIALTDMFKSSAVPRGDAPRLRFMAAYYSYVVGNYDDTLAQLGYAKTLGYKGIDATLLSADTYLRKNQPKAARPFVQAALAQRKASGEAVPLAWYDRAISMAYQAGDWTEVGQLYRERLAIDPSTGAWRSALANFLADAELDSQAQLDLYRLQAANGAMASERDYQAYASLAEKTRYDAETKAVIEAGRKNGKLIPTQAVTAKLMQTVTPKAVKEIAGLPAQAKKAAAASNGKLALGDTYMSLAQYPQAVEQYRLALTKGGVDADRANSRLGVALARSGDLASARQTLSQVSGRWANVAGFWLVWVDQQSRKAAARAEPAQPRKDG